MFHKAIIIFCAVLLTPPALAAPAKYRTESSALTPAQQALYLDIERSLDDWGGKGEDLPATKAKIDSFIISAPDFLPVYIEKARLTIRMGTIGNSDEKAANRDALAILADLRKKDPSYAKTYVLAGRVHLNLLDLENARKSLEHAERLGTSDPWLYNNWSALFGQQEQYDKAVAYARKALSLSGANSKAMAAAIYFISTYSRFTSQPAKEGDVTQLVFESFKDPEQRIRIATRLIDDYNGNPSLLDRAAEIIDRQEKETPRLESVALAKAEWLLKKGYLRTENMIARYDPRLSSAAELILDAIPPSKSANPEIFSLKFAIALGDDNIHKVNTLLKGAAAGGIPKRQVMESEAWLAWRLKSYAEVIRILENVPESEQSTPTRDLLLSAYSRLGQPERLTAYYKKLVDMNPGSAWNMGNYAGMLLHTNDIDGAIKYGEGALRLMHYGIAANTTALAHLMKATQLKRTGQPAAAKKHIERAMAIGISRDFAMQYCDTYCAEISEVLARQ